MSRGTNNTRAPGQEPQSKADTVSDALLRLAHEMGPNAKLPTVRALRDRFGVSQATLDTALSRLENRRVLSRLQGSGLYVSPTLGRRNVALICAPEAFLRPGISPFWFLLVEQMRNRAAGIDIDLSLHFTRTLGKDRELEQPQDSSLLDARLRDDVSAGGVQGVLAIELPHSLTRWIEARGVPVVAFAGPANYIVGFSHGALVQCGVAELARQGCRRVELWSPWPFNDADGNAQYYRETFEGALTAHNLPGAFVNPLGAQRNSTSAVEYGFTLAGMRFGPDSPPNSIPDGILFLDDMMTQGAMMAFQKLGIRPGEGVHVATHANAGSPALLGWQDRLTLLEIDLSEIVQAMFDTLDCLMDAGNGGDISSPAIAFDSPEVPSGALVPPERFRLIRPRVVRPTVIV